MPDSGGAGYLQLGQPEFSEQLMRAGNLKGDLPGSVATRYQPVFQVDDFTLPEYRALRRMSRYLGGARQNAVAGEFSFIALLPQLTMPRFISICEQVVIGNPDAAARSILVSVGQPGFAVAGGAGAGASTLDDRSQAPNANAAVPYANIRQGTNPAQIISGAAMFFELAPSTTYTIQLGAVLTNRQNNSAVPASVAGVLVQMGTANIALSASFIWRERSVLESETL